MQGKGVKPGKGRRNKGGWPLLTFEKQMRSKLQVDALGAEEVEGPFPCLREEVYTNNHYL